MNEIKRLFVEYPAFAWSAVIVLILLALYFANQVNKNNASTTTGQSNIPTYILYDATQQATPGTTGTTTTGGTTTGNKPPVTHNPGSVFKGPTGVLHYVSTGSETLSAIAKKFSTGTWNSIYAIPDNQKILGKMDATQAKNFTPQKGLVITLPPNATNTGL